MIGSTQYTRSDLCVPRADVTKLVEQLRMSIKCHGDDCETYITKNGWFDVKAARDTLAEFNAKHGE